MPSQNEWASFVHTQSKQLWVYSFYFSYFDMSIAQNDLIIVFIDFLPIFAQFCSHYNMFIHSITYIEKEKQ